MNKHQEKVLDGMRVEATKLLADFEAFENKHAADFNDLFKEYMVWQKKEMAHIDTKIGKIKEEHKPKTAAASATIAEVKRTLSEWGESTLPS